MNSHPYLRAYMAGIAVPTMFLLLVMTAFCAARFVWNIPVPIERVIVFPMALVPNLWGVWNMLYVKLRPRYPLGIGLHGAVLPFFLAPVGFTIGRALLDVSFLTPKFAAVTVPVAVVVYYLAWKHLVGFFNEVLGIT